MRDVARVFTEVRRDVVRREILTTAEQLVARHGIASTSMGQVAEAVGIGRQAMYHYFPSKGDLVAATIRNAVDRYESFSVIPRDAPLPEQLAYLVTRLVHNIAGRDNSPLRFFFTVLLEQLDEPVDRQPVRSIIDAYTRRVSELIELNKERGQVRPDIDHVEAARRLTSNILGLQWMWLLHAGEIDLEAMAAHIEQEFLTSLALR